MITLLILIVNMWWNMFTGTGFLHGDLGLYLLAGVLLACVECLIIIMCFIMK